MKTVFLFLSLSLFISVAQAGLFGDDDKRCYDWYGNRESCQRLEPRRESLIAGQFNAYYGEETGSMTGSFGQGLLMTTVKSRSVVRFLFGGQLLYSAANSYINNSSAIGTTMMSADLIFGLSIKPYNDTYLKPIFEIDLIGGLKSIEFASPPAGIEEKNLKPSYGGKILLGLDIPISRTSSLRPALDYQITRVDGIIDGESFVLDALGVSLGWVFQ